jgi:hypothetical protein
MTAISSITRAGRAGCAVLAFSTLLLAASCMVKETRPLPKLAAVQATSEIPTDQLLDVGVRLFDPGLPKEIEEHPELGEKKGISVDIRKAEARYLPTLLRSTLEGTGQWGAVRVVPPAVAVMDVMVEGKIIESNGYQLALQVSVSDATGRHWFTKHYQQEADTSSYREGPGRARDPFQNIYVEIADDMLAFRAHLPKPDVAAVPRVARLRFGGDLAPAAYQEYLAKDRAREGKAEYRVVRLPAEDDPIVERVDRIRERDAALIDTVSDHYASFAEKMVEPYAGWRRSTYDELDAEQKLRNQAMTRKVLGAAAVLGGILIPTSCGGSSNCGRIESVARAGAVAGGVMAVMSGFQKGKEAQMHTDALKEITGSFQTEAAPMVVDVEGRTLKLTGTAEAQFAEWRRLLRDLYQEETGAVSVADAAPAAAAVHAATHSTAENSTTIPPGDPKAAGAAPSTDGKAGAASPESKDKT